MAVVGGQASGYWHRTTCTHGVKHRLLVYAMHALYLCYLMICRGGCGMENDLT